MSRRDLKTPDLIPNGSPEAPERVARLGVVTDTV
jgi:hypothetical protein